MDSVLTTGHGDCRAARLRAGGRRDRDDVALEGVGDEKGVGFAVGVGHDLKRRRRQGISLIEREPPIDAPRDPLYKTESEIMKPFL
ncbi:uncharacterized protein A4U43_C04F17640 [Asparagus officinalis]|uniref:Uncharacterized protein n=1 Tax=Asparagus officinalis TaxID=4686 RepID=A0A5P1F283_ASPOF|nr:uncharacterized protein A4U43_C04F17640 [Asparagus officinalis]